MRRAEAVKYDTLSYKPQDAEIKYFLSDFCRLYYSCNRYTMRDNFKKSLLFMEAQLANSVAEAYRKNHTVEGYLQDSSAVSDQAPPQIKRWKSTTQWNRSGNFGA